MRTRQDGKRHQPLWVLIRDLPRETGTPVVTNKVEPPIAMSDSGHNIERVADQPIDPVAGVVSRVRSCAGRIPPLVGSHREIPGIPERVDLGVPEEARDPEAMQHEHQRRSINTVYRHIEGHARCYLYVARPHHGAMVDATHEGSNVDTCSLIPVTVVCRAAPSILHSSSV